MLFYITRDAGVKIELTNKYQLGNFIIFTDLGWTLDNTSLHKGYGIGQENGNYCILKLDNNELIIETDNSRSFPIWFSDNSISNCVKLEKLCYATHEIKFSHIPILQAEHKFSYEDKKTCSFEQAVDWCCEYLVDITQQTFKNNTLPVYAAESYGVDSLTVISALDYSGVNYKMSNCFSTPYDASLSPNFQFVNEYWGYYQLYYDSNSHIQATGFSGDESMSRNPMYAHWLMVSRGLDLMDTISKANENSYMKYYYNSYEKYFKEDSYKRLSKKAAYNLCFKQSANDFQMWHLDNAITFTPLRNFSLLDKMLHLDDDALIRQVVNAEINKEVINRLSPKLLLSLDVHKNKTQRKQRIAKYSKEFDPGIYSVI